MMAFKTMDPIDKDETVYSIEPHPLHERGYHIMKSVNGSKAYPIGEYVVMDKDEPKEVSDEKVNALKDSLNISQDKIELMNVQKQNEPNEKQSEKQYVSFQRVGAKHEDHVPAQIIFYNNYDAPNGGTTREVNAVLTFAKGETE